MYCLHHPAPPISRLKHVSLLLSLLGVLVSLCLGPTPARAEGEPFTLAEQNAPLRIQIPGTGAWSAKCDAIEPYGGIIYPGQTVRFTLSVVNSSKEKNIAGKPTLEIVRFGSKLEKEGGNPGDFHTQGHLITYVPFGEAKRYEQADISVEPGKAVQIAWKQESPNDFAAFGIYVVIVDLPGFGRQPAATFARCHAYNEKTGDGKASPLFWSLHHVDRPGQLRIAAAVGYRWIRTDGFPNWSEADGDFPRTNKPFDWTQQDKMMDLFRQLKLWVQSNMYGSPRGTVSDRNWAAYNYVHDPRYDYRWGDYVEAAVQRYCGPDGNGPLQLIDYWNEPWEGGGISAWKSDSIRYRQLYKILYERAHKGSPHIIVGAASSIMNTCDKFMTVPKWQDLYTLDVFTDHYVQPYCSYGPRMARQAGVFSIETETWIGFDEHQLVGVASHFMAAGQSKVNCNHPVQLAWMNGDAGGWMPKPAVMGANSFLYFVAARPFNRIVFQSHLPWLYQYGTGKDSVFVLSGDRRLLNPAAVGMYNQIRAEGTIRVDSAGGKIKAYDVYGNAIEAQQDGTYALPLSRMAVYLEAPGEDESLVVESVRKGEIRNIRPVQIFMEDFAAPVASSEGLEFEVHNVLNRQLAGKLAIAAPSEVTLAAPEQSIELAAGERKRVVVKLRSAKPNAANAYPCKVTFVSDAGAAELSEVLHANTITRGTPKIDGDLADWGKAVPVIVQGADLKRDATEAAWRPWEKEAGVKAGLAEVRFMYDDTYLYAAVRERTEGYAPKPRLSVDPEQSYCFGTDDLAHTYVKSIEATAPYTGSCVQIGFDVCDFRMLPAMPNVPEGMLAMEDTDYEYAAWGTPDSGGEIWRSVAPRMKFFHFLPRCFPSGYDGVPRGAKVRVKRTGADTIYEIAIPLADMPELQPGPGKQIHIAMRLPASKIELGFGRSATRSNGLSMLPRWEVHASNEIRWGFTE